MHNAGLQCRGRKHRLQRLGHALQAIGHGDQDVVHTARLQVAEDFHPELRAFGGLDPQAQNVACAVRQDTQRQVDGFVAHQSFFANLHAQRVEEDDWVHHLERTSLPRGDLLHYRISHRTDELRGHLCTVLLRQKALDLAHRHTARVHRDNLVVEACEPSLVFRYQDRLETAVAITRNLQPQGPLFGQYGLACFAIAMIGHLVRPLSTGRVAQVMAQFGSQRSLDQRLFERHRCRLDRFRAHRAGYELLYQLFRNRRQRRLGLASSSLLAGWHTCSLVDMLCLTHKIYDTPD
ncbi:Uncharacterised protein [Burkholderia pseudomallei]|nr:Uncharacterised protein [Burkholderia pseudomallei]CPI08816.1 Uncharacterised protein [Burkholderia pseudomallei]